jgi:hypothetical protein
MKNSVVMKVVLDILNSSLAFTCKLGLYEIDLGCKAVLEEMLNFIVNKRE